MPSLFNNILPTDSEKLSNSLPSSFNPISPIVAKVASNIFSFTLISVMASCLPSSLLIFSICSATDKDLSFAILLAASVNFLDLVVIVMPLPS